MWGEEYLGGSAEVENKIFERFAPDIMQVQTRVQRRLNRHGVKHPIQRAFHAKATLTVDDAELRFGELPDDLQVGFAQPGAEYPTIVRFSNASGTVEPDRKPDLRGIALRVCVDDNTSHDLLATNFPVSHARDATQFVEFAKQTAGGKVSRLFGLVNLARRFGIPDTFRMVRNVMTASRQSVSSIATQTYWSRGAMTWGPALAVRFLLRPAPDTPPGPDPDTSDPSYLSHEAARRLVDGDIRFELCIQRYVNETVTPIENTAIEWTEENAPAQQIATLTIHQAKSDTPDAQARSETVDRIAFNPWNTTDEFRPLGSLNRARKQVYDASAAHREQMRWHTEIPVRNVIVGTIARRLYSLVNRYREWHQLPAHLALLNLDVLRGILREHNLIDTEPREVPPRARTVPPEPPQESRSARTPDGSHNDLSAPKMGAVGSRFGRNLAADYQEKLFNTPNPIEVSEVLLKRDHFLPARSLNMIAAAWIQFQVHDWVKHRQYKLGEHDIEIAVPDGVPWANSRGGPIETTMRIAGDETVDARTRRNEPEPSFKNVVSHWWDGSEVYGSDAATTAGLRQGAKILLTHDGYLPIDRMTGLELTGFTDSSWLGLSALHTLFAREHNVVCDELRAHYCSWRDDRIFNTARLIVSALIAKIHTVEWTPAILATRPIELGMNVNWYGPPSNDWLSRLGAWLLDSHASVGIPSTKPDHHGVPFSMTEDFVTIYRLHPLIPDDYRFLDHKTGELLHTRTFPEISGTHAGPELRSVGLENAMYSLGLAHPGAIRLNNFPNSLLEFEHGDGQVNLGVVDIVRSRRRGVPRYNDFRAGLHKPRVTDWEELSDDPKEVGRIQEVYESIDQVDTMIGLFAEKPPDGFAFSETAFRIFLLMASRRIQSDRFLTVDFRPEIYSPLGMDWVQRNTMNDVILRHCPNVAGFVPRNQSAFAPWRPV